MSGVERRSQVLRIAAEEFADGGLHGASTELIARRAGITPRRTSSGCSGPRKALFLEVVVAAFDRMTEGMSDAAGAGTGLGADPADGVEGQLDADVAGRTSPCCCSPSSYAACGDPKLGDAVRANCGRMWQRSPGPPISTR